MSFSSSPSSAPGPSPGAASSSPGASSPGSPGAEADLPHPGDGPAPAPGEHPAAPRLAVIVPTFNEAENVEPIARRLMETLAGIPHEIIFVDDSSPDGTADRLRQLARRHPQIRCLQRIGRRGLSGAVSEGFLATSAPVVAVIDADMQHDETILTRMLETLEAEGADMVVATRYAEGGGFGDWPTLRRRMSRLATWLARRLTGVELSDPMSGFFMLRSACFRARAPGLTGKGYKILLDILSTPGDGLEIREIPYQFRARQAGQSKLDGKVMLDFVELLLARAFGGWMPVKFVMFAMVGALGVLVHMGVLAALFGTGLSGFAPAQAIATLVAMTTNFLVNNVFTYHDRKLRGWQLLPGWLSFAVASSVGALSNVGLAVFLFERVGLPWVAAALAGIVAGAIWNYAMTSFYTWRERG